MIIMPNGPDIVAIVQRHLIKKNRSSSFTLDGGRAEI